MQSALIIGMVYVCALNYEALSQSVTGDGPPVTDWLRASWLPAPTLCNFSFDFHLPFRKHRLIIVGFYGVSTLHGSKAVA